MKRSLGLRLAGAALAVGLGAGVFSACGSSSSSSSSTTASPRGSANGVLSAFHATTAAGTAKLSMQVGVHATTTSSSAPAVNEVITAQGATSFTDHSSQLTMNIPQVGTLQVVVVKGAAYVMLPPAEQAATGGKPWAKVDTSQLGSTSQFSDTDPSQVLSILEGASSGVMNLGTADVRGVKATHYHFNLNLSALAAATGQSSSSLSRSLQQLHLTTLPVDVYVDGKGRLVRLAIDVALPASALAGQAAAQQVTSLRFEISFDLFDYGTPVSITAPPADQVGSLSGSALSGLGAGAVAPGTVSPTDSATQ